MTLIARAYDGVRNYRPTLAAPAQVGKNLTAIAIPVIAYVALSSLQTADAGPWAACICIAACVGLIEAPPLFAACLAACGVAAGLPTP
jgi:hypothetical protein